MSRIANSQQRCGKIRSSCLRADIHHESCRPDRTGEDFPDNSDIAIIVDTRISDRVFFRISIITLMHSIRDLLYF